MASTNSMLATKKIVMPLLFLILLAIGCSKAKQVHDGGTNAVTWVSVGRIRTSDFNRRNAIFDFFTSNNIPSYPEGWPTCEVMVPKEDFEQVHVILRTTRPPGIDFVSIWDKEQQTTN